MHVLLIHNAYGKISGEEVVVNSLLDLCQQHGHQVSTYFRSSEELVGNRLRTAKAFFDGIYSIQSKLAVRRLLQEKRPDVVHVHNLFPLISPSILGECRRAGVPVVMTVHNYRLVCPNGLHISQGAVCEKCVGGHEYQCMLNRCEGSLFKSAGYAARNAFARKMGLFHKNVSLYLALTEFQRRRLIAAGFRSERIVVAPNMAESVTPAGENLPGEWVGYVGRVSHEKGIPTILAAAAENPHIPYRIAGAFDRMADVVAGAPRNVTFVGHLNSDALPDFYRRSRMILLASTWFEGFPTMLLQAKSYGKPVICSRIGGLPEIVDDQVTGLLFTPGDSHDLYEKVHKLWSDPGLCRQMGEAGREKAARQYSRQAYYERLIAAYDRAIELGPGGITTDVSAVEEDLSLANEV